MADTKITGLTEDASPSTDDLVVTVNDPGGTPVNRKVTIANLLATVKDITVSTGASAPGTTPNAAGDIFVDTTADTVYIATGNASSADWKLFLDETSGTVLTSVDVALDDELPLFDTSDSGNAKKDSIQDLQNLHGINAQTGTTYTLVLADRAKTVTMSNASANTLTIPTNASVAFPVGTSVNVAMLGAGTTSVAGATGVTLNGVSAGTGAINTQYQGVTLLKTATDTWIAMGDIGTVA